MFLLPPTDHFPPKPKHQRQKNNTKGGARQDRRFQFSRFRLTQAFRDDGGALLTATAFADGFPALLTSEASLAALNAAIAGGPEAAQGPLPMARFRPNVVVRGGPAMEAWEEDTWRAFSLGGVPARGVKRCSRCLVTTTDQETGKRPGNRSTSEPLRTLAELRTDKARAHVFFGMNVCFPPPHEAEAETLLRVGAPVLITERGPIPPL